VSDDHIVIERDDREQRGCVLAELIDEVGFGAGIEGIDIDRTDPLLVSWLFVSDVHSFTPWL